MLKPLMKFILLKELRAHPEHQVKQEIKAATLSQELLEKLWKPEDRPTSFWGQMKFSLMGNDTELPQKLFDRILAFRTQHQLTNQKAQMNRVMFYTTKAFNEGVEMMAAACYLFYHIPQAFEKYATSSSDFKKDCYESSFHKENITAPPIPPIWMAVMASQFEQERQRFENRRLPLLSFAPFKYGYHPCLTKSATEIRTYQKMLVDPFFYKFRSNPNRFTHFKKVLSLEMKDSHYPSEQHLCIIAALNAFNKRLTLESTQDKPKEAHGQLLFSFPEK